MFQSCVSPIACSDARVCLVEHLKTVIGHNTQVLAVDLEDETAKSNAAGGGSEQLASEVAAEQPVAAAAASLAA